MRAREFTTLALFGLVLASCFLDGLPRTVALYLALAIAFADRIEWRT